MTSVLSTITLRLSNNDFGNEIWIEIESTDKDKVFAILALNKCLTIYTLNINLKRVSGTFEA